MTPETVEKNWHIAFLHDFAIETIFGVFFLFLSFMIFFLNNFL